MKQSPIIKVALISFALFSSQSYAAKENFDRSKPHKANIEKPCDIKTPACKKAMKEKMMKKKKQQVKAKTRAQDYNSSRSNRGETAKPELEAQKKLSKAKTRATDYNSSRSNKADGAKEKLEDGHNKLIKSKSRATDYNSSRSNKSYKNSAPIEAKKGDKKEDNN